MSPLNVRGAVSSEKDMVLHYVVWLSLSNVSWEGDCSSRKTAKSAVINMQICK